MKKVRVGSVYYWYPVGPDVWDPKLQRELRGGEAVRVVNLPGAPPANTMGHCYIADPATGTFLGLVLTASLHKVEMHRLGRHRENPRRWPARRIQWVASDRDDNVLGQGVFSDLSTLKGALKRVQGLHPDSHRIEVTFDENEPGSPDQTGYVLVLPGRGVPSCSEWESVDDGPETPVIHPSVREAEQSLADVGEQGVPYQAIIERVKVHGKIWTFARGKYRLRDLRRAAGRDDDEDQYRSID